MTTLGPPAHFEETSPEGRRRRASALVAVFAVALAFRLGALWFFAPPEPNYNYRLARGLITAHAFAFGPEPTSYIEPLYPAFLASGMFLFGSDRLVLLLQAIVSASGAPALLSDRLAADRDAQRRRLGRDALCRRSVLRSAGPLLHRGALRRAAVALDAGTPGCGTSYGSGGRCRSADVASSC